MPDPLLRLRNCLAPIHDLSAAAAVLEWDQETYLPAAANTARSNQVATLRTLAHERLTSDETVQAVADAQPLLAELEARDDDDAIFDAGLIRETARDLAHAQKLSSDFVSRRATAIGLAKEAWRHARETDDFDHYAPHLETIVALNRELADLLGYEDHPYDALLDQFEPGATTAQLQQVFGDLRERLVPIVQTLSERKQPGLDAVSGDFPADAQWVLGMQALADIGFDLSRGRQDVSAHPFTTTFDRTDVRITTRIDPHYFPSAFSSTMHEAGHGMYEQGVDPRTARTPLAEGTSLGMHESQSRLWENLVGRSRPFWSHYWPQTQAAFPHALSGVTLDEFYASMNHVAPSPIRVEADEVTYNLHIMLRMELETRADRGHAEGRRSAVGLERCDGELPGDPARERRRGRAPRRALEPGHDRIFPDVRAGQPDVGDAVGRLRPRLDACARLARRANGTRRVRPVARLDAHARPPLGTCQEG